jgi:hypothetical protein
MPWPIWPGLYLYAATDPARPGAVPGPLLGRLFFMCSDLNECYYFNDPDPIQTTENTQTPAKAVFSASGAFFCPGGYKYTTPPPKTRSQAHFRPPPYDRPSYAKMTTPAAQITAQTQKTPAHTGNGGIFAPFSGNRWPDLGRSRMTDRHSRHSRYGFS